VDRTSYRRWFDSHRPPSLGRTEGRKQESQSSWQLGKVKYDRQIVAIAKANGASEIYSEDPDIVKIAAPLGIKVVSVCNLSLPYQTYKGDTLFAMGDAADDSEEEGK